MIGPGWLTVMVLAAVAGPPRPLSAAESDTTGPTRELRDSLGASVNLPGLQNTLETSWRWKHAAVGVAHVLAPSYTRANLWAEAVPVRFLALRAGIEPAGYFGIGTALLAFDGYEADFSKEAREQRDDQEAGFGGRAYVSAALRVRAGALVATSTAEHEWWRFTGDGPFYYEPTRDALLKATGDSLWTLTSMALVERDLGAGKKLSFGANHRLLRVPDARQNDGQKLGGVALWTLGERRFGVRQPTLALNVGVYLDDRFKNGEAFAALGLRFRLGR